MPSKKKKYNARFPAGRIKKIMQSDEEVGKVAQAVPIIISRTLELFVESLLAKTLKITNSRNAKTLSPSHMKQCIMSESRFDFLRELVKNIPDISVADEAAQESSGPYQDSSGSYIDMQQPYDLSKPSTSSEANISPARNGNSSSIRNGAPATYVTATTVQIPTMDSIPTAVIEHRSELKRQWDIVHASRKQQKEKISSVIHHTSEATECSPPKIARMDSAPTGYYDTVKNYSNKRLQHQPKSMPCTSKEVNTNKQSIIPAPIVNIDVCNRPIVKIDYSNLALHDKELTDSGSQSPPSTPLTCINPVINIDLSNIATQSNNDLPKVSNSAGGLRPSLELDEDYDNI